MQPWQSQPARAAGRRGEAGFSVVEALIAAAILLIIALGLLPLFSRAINDNVSGNDATQATNASRTQIEALMQLPIDNQQLAATPDGTTDYYTAGQTNQLGDADEGWQTSATGHGAVLWNRTTRVTQMTLADLDSTGLNKNAITLKQIEVQVDNPKKELFGNGQGMTLHMIKYN